MQNRVESGITLNLVNAFYVHICYSIRGYFFTVVICDKS